MTGLTRGALVASLGVAGVTWLAGSRPIEEPSPLPVVARKVSREKLLIPETALAGRYYQGDGLGVNLSLNLLSDNTFTFTWHGCLGEYDKNKGSWRMDGDVLELAPTGPNEQKGFQGMDLRFIPVKWGERVYLVEELSMPAFAAYSKREKPGVLDDVHGTEYVKVSTNGKPAPLKGKPILPKRYQEFYDLGPAQAKVLEISASGEVTLGNLDHRLKPAMLLAANEFVNLDLELVSVSGDKAIARPIYYWNSSRLPRVGEVFTSGGRWHSPNGTGSKRYASLAQAMREGDRK